MQNTKSFFLVCFIFLTSMSFAQVDPDFGISGYINFSVCSNTSAADMLLYDDGRILALGVAGCAAADGSNNIAMARYLSTGDFDASFGGGVVEFDLGTEKNDEFYSMLLKPDGKILLGGNAYQTGSQEDFSIVQINDNGTLDSTFGVNGAVIVNNPATTQTGKKILLQTDGKIILAGNARSGLNDSTIIMRFLENGIVDSTFGINGIAVVDLNENSERLYDAVLTEDGKIIVIGRCTTDANGYFIARLNDNGSIDETFGVDGFITYTEGMVSISNFGLAQQSDGKLLVAYTDYDLTDVILISRYLADGSIDETYGTLGLAEVLFDNSVDLTDIQIKPDDALIICSQVAGVPEPFITVCKIDINGTIDLIFGGDGFIEEEAEEYSAHCIDPSPDGAIYISGNRVAGGTTYMFTMRVKDMSTDINASLSIENFASIAPNPVADVATLTLNLLPNEKISILISDYTGKIQRSTEYVYTNAEGKLNYPLSFNNLPAGLYFVNILANNQRQSIAVTLE